MPEFPLDVEPMTADLEIVWRPFGPPWPLCSAHGKKSLKRKAGGRTCFKALDELQRRASEDGSQILWDVSSFDPDVDTSSDACLVFFNAFATEGMDRPGSHDDESDLLVTKVAAACNNTIVVIHNAGVRIVDRFVDHPNVTAVIFAHLPGQDSGRAIVSLPYGQTSFSGKLPYTVPRNESDLGTASFPDTSIWRVRQIPTRRL